ncbi:MAG: GNAT family N-acetyltransferase [Chloroflexota bacterium]
MHEIPVNEHYIDESELDELAGMFANAETGAASVHAWLHNLQTQGITHLRRQLHSLRDDFDHYKSIIDRLGLPLLQTKRAFMWNEPRPRVIVPDRLVYRSYVEVGHEVFFDTVLKAHQHTLDRSVRSALIDLDHWGIGHEVWMQSEFDDATEYFIQQPEWWQVAYTQTGTLVGYVQPVLFPNSEQDRDGQRVSEATLYYIGVLPEARGNGYVDDLLLKSIAILQEVGIWRLYSDTDSENFPMIRAFERAGFEEDGLYYIWGGELKPLIETYK